MNTKQLINQWFEKWESGEYQSLPISDDFVHKSPFGRIEGKTTYFDLVRKNEDKFTGQTFEILDAIFKNEKACVRYIARQGDGFSLDVSEWYYIKDNLIHEIYSYYHIGEIRGERQLEE